MDRLSFLLHQFSLRADVFHRGPLCGARQFEGALSAGHLHLVVRGPVQLTAPDGTATQIEEPSVIFVPRAAAHQLASDAPDGAELVCAAVDLGGLGNPIAESLPPLMVVPLTQLPGSQALLSVLLQEAFAPRCGAQAALDRLCELLLIHVFRYALEHRLSHAGALAGLADPKLAKALLALHEDPARPWRLEDMAREAGMSRARFAARFHTVVGQTPADYLAAWRVGWGQRLLRKGEPLGRVAEAVGYGSASAFTRAFTRHLGVAPGAWLRGT